MLTVLPIQLEILVLSQRQMAHHNQEIFYEDSLLGQKFEDSEEHRFFVREPDALECLDNSMPMPTRHSSPQVQRLSPEMPSLPKKVTKKHKKNNQDSTYFGFWHSDSQQVEIFHQDESQNNQPVKSQIFQATIGSQEDERSHGSDLKSGSARSKSNQNKGKTNDYKTKNFLQFLMKGFRRYVQLFYDGEDYKEARKMWDILKDQNKLKISLIGFTDLLRCQKLRRCWRHMFQCNYLKRQIIGSNISLELKRIYLNYVKVVRQGYRNRRLDYLN